MFRAVTRWRAQLMTDRRDHLAIGPSQVYDDPQDPVRPRDCHGQRQAGAHAAAASSLDIHMPSVRSIMPTNRRNVGDCSDPREMRAAIARSSVRRRGIAPPLRVEAWPSIVGA